MASGVPSPSSSGALDPGRSGVEPEVLEEVAIVLGLYLVLDAVHSGVPVRMPGCLEPGPGLQPPPRTAGPRSREALERMFPGPESGLRLLSDEELASELRKARARVDWHADPGRWLQCWDRRVAFIGLDTLSNGL